MFGSVKLICSHAALKDSDVRMFPESQNRSQRIHKKLVKRFGSEFRKVPAIWQMGDTLIAHPEMFHLIKQEIANERRTAPDPLPSREDPQVGSSDMVLMAERHAGLLRRHLGRRDPVAIRIMDVS